MNYADSPEMHAMVMDLERLRDKGGPGSTAARFRLHQLANATGDDWNELVGHYLLDRLSPPAASSSGSAGAEHGN